MARPRVRELLRRSPAVALLGPRQSGKTTLAKSLGGRYFDLEQEEDRLRLDVEWDRLAAGRALVVLDEAQAHPALFPRLRGAIDRRRPRRGRYLLLGSIAPNLMRRVSESLAGRLALCEISPLLAAELPAGREASLWLHGGFPEGGVLERARPFPGWQLDYLRLLAERDLPGWGLPARPHTTLRLLRMLAAVHGAAWNASEVGRSLGLSYHTVNSYADYLEGAYLIRRLPQFAGSLRKRLMRSPRLYWRDSGLLHALHGVRSWDGLLAQPWVGASWEGFVIAQALDLLAVTGRPHDAAYLRTSDGYEIDLLLELEGRRWAIEVKLTTAPGPADFDRLSRAADLVGAERRILVSRTSAGAVHGRNASVNLVGLLSLLRS